ELGDISSKTIIVELMGRHSNIILLDPAAGTVIDGIHHVTPAISSYRIVMPGSAYTPPPAQHKEHPFLVNGERFVALLAGQPAAGPDSAGNEAAFPGYDKQDAAERGGETWEERLVSRFSGISPLVARELVFRAQPPLTAANTPEANAKLLWE